MRTRAAGTPRKEVANLDTSSRCRTAARVIKESKPGQRATMRGGWALRSITGYGERLTVTQRGKEEASRSDIHDRWRRTDALRKPDPRRAPTRSIQNLRPRHTSKVRPTGRLHCASKPQTDLAISAPSATSGPLAKKAGLRSLAQASTGIMSVTGSEAAPARLRVAVSLIE
ncbi:hypothetical protein FQR65_LT20884 [Abscondita terminalis]|nr:hypothetical protein FQR65_LT20884 [Abscondita terminalis]